MGKLSDKYGRKTMLIIASVLFIALTVPFVSYAKPGWVFNHCVDSTGVLVLLSVNDGTLPAFLRFLVGALFIFFPFSRVRYSGAQPLMAFWLMSKRTVNRASLVIGDSKCNRAISKR